MREAGRGLRLEHEEDPHKDHEEEDEHQGGEVEEHHEGAYYVLIRAYARSGQRPTAKQIYDQYLEMLNRFGLEPESDWDSLCH